MYPSTFYQPVYHQSSCGYEGTHRRSQPSFLVSPDRSCRNVSYIDYQRAIAQQHRQRVQAAAQRHRDHERRQEQVRQLVLERERALQRESRRRLLAQREYERHLEKKRQEQAALRAWYVAEREARLNARRQAEEKTQREEQGFVELLDSLFHYASQSSPGEQPSARDVELQTEQAQAFSESEPEEDEEESDADAMDKFLNTLFEGFALQRGATPSVEQPQATTAEGVASTENVDVGLDVSPSTASEPLESTVEATTTEQSESAVDAAPQDTSQVLEDVQQRYAENLIRVERLETLDTLEEKLVTLTSGFTFPSHLDFQEDTNSAPTSDDSTPFIPALTYTSANVPYHSHAQSLLGLLVEADAVESNGDEEVRKKRKEFVGRVEVELDALERRKAEVWEQRG